MPITGEFIVDYSEVDSFEFQPVPNGLYKATIDATMAVSCGVRYGQGEKGTPYVTIEFVVNEGPYQGRKIRDNLMLAGKGAARTGRVLKATGYEPVAGEKSAFNFRELHNKHVVIKVSSREYNGQFYNQIDAIVPADTLMQ
jgi:hypothetical protein